MSQFERLSSLILILSTLPSTLAQCPPALIPLSGFPGIDGRVNCQTHWDPDGDGPAEPWLILGGEFNTVADVPARNVVAWDGARWHSIGDGLGDPVYGLISYRGRLIATHNAAKQPVGRLSTWDGSNWTLIADTFRSGATDSGAVGGLHVFQDELIVCGSFDEIDGVAAGNIAAWNGQSWHGLAGGVGLLERKESIANVGALATWQGRLIVGGLFERAGDVGAASIAAWDGQTWQAVGKGLFDQRDGRLVAGQVKSLQPYNGQLYVAGTFRQAGERPIQHLAYWTGTDWNALLDFEAAGVSELTEYRGMLLIAGAIYSAGPLTDQILVAWDGSAYSGFRCAYDHSDTIHTLAPYNDTLFAFGNFESLAETALRNAGVWDGTRWHALAHGLTAGPRKLVSFQGSLIAAGGFSVSGDEQIHGLARWDGQHWVSLRPGRSTISAVAVDGHSLYVAGWLSDVDGPADRGVARFDGQSWQRIGEPFNNAIHALCIHRGVPYAAGWFTAVGTRDLEFLAAWDGQAWQPVTSRFAEGPYALFSAGDNLVVGTGYKVFGQPSADYICRLDASGWHAMGGGLSFFPHDMVAVDGALIAGGDFIEADGSPANHVAAWNGLAWSALGDGIPEGVHTLLVHRGRLHAGSDRGVHMWNGETWNSIGGPIDALGDVEHVAQHGSRIAIAGDFTQVGGFGAFVALWGPETLPCDANCDGSINAFDIDAFADLLAGAEPCAPCAGDVNQDGATDAFDIEPFVAALSGNAC